MNGLMLHVLLPICCSSWVCSWQGHQPNDIASQYLHIMCTFQQKVTSNNADTNDSAWQRLFIKFDILICVCCVCVFCLLVCFCFLPFFVHSLFGKKVWAHEPEGEKLICVYKQRQPVANMSFPPFPLLFPFLVFCEMFLLCSRSSWNWSYKVVVSCLMGAGNQTGCSARTVCAFQYQASLQLPIYWRFSLLEHLFIF